MSYSLITSLNNNMVVVLILSRVIGGTQTIDEEIRYIKSKYKKKVQEPTIKKLSFQILPPV